MPNSQGLDRIGRDRLRKYLSNAGLEPKFVRPPKPAYREIDQLVQIRLPNGKRAYVAAEFKANPRHAPIESAIAQLCGALQRHGQPNVFPLVFSWHFGKPMRD